MAACAQILSAQQPATTEGSQYDAQGHLVSYIYKDGTRDLYAYDARWRMIKYVGRDGQKTYFQYNADGTMQAH